MSLAVTLTLKIANQSFAWQFRLMIMYHHTKFGYKILGGLEDLMWTNIYWYFEPPFAVTLTLNVLILFFFDKTLWIIMMYHWTKFGWQKFSSSEDIVERVIVFLIIRALIVILTLKIANRFFCMTLGLMALHCNTMFGNKAFCSWENIILTNIQWHFEPLLWPLPWKQWSSFLFFTRHSGLECCTIKPAV